MNKLALLLLLFFTLGFSQETDYLTENYEFQKGDIVYMFGNDVKLRDQPNLDSDVLTLLKIGEQIEIIGKSNSSMLFEGIRSPWYKVKFKDKVGFVLGGLISLDKVTYGNLTYLVALKKDGYLLFAKTRVFDNSLDYKEDVSLLNTHNFNIKATGNKGLENVESIFLLDYYADACGIDGGGIYLFYDGKNLKKAIEFTQVGDADAFWLYEEYIFPNDNEGIQGKIVYKSELGETMDYETEWVEKKFVRRLVKWDGNKITPKIEVDTDY